MRGREGRCGTIPHPLNLLNPHPLTSLLSLANTPSSPKLPFPHLTENVCSSNEFQTSHKHLSGGVRQGGGGGEKGVGREEVEWEEEEGVGEWEGEEVEREEGGGGCEERRQGMDDNSRLMTEI